MVAKPTTKHDWKDISCEERRTYVFVSAEVVIEHPTWLAVSNSGGHRIVDSMGVGHYVPTGWVHLFWQPVEGKETFVC